MKCYRSQSVYLLLIFLVFFVNCQTDKHGFSLGRSRTVTDIDECFNLAKKKDHEKAVKCFEVYRSANRGSPLAAMADLAIADSYFQQKQYLSAAEMYGVFAQTYPFHEKIPYAYFKQGQSYFKAAPKAVDRNLSLLDDAMRALETVISYYRNTDVYDEASQLYKEIKIRQAKKEFYIGRFYFKQREYLSAIERFKGVVTNYPDLGFEDKSFYYLLKGLVATSQKPVAENYFAAYKRVFPNRTEQIAKFEKILK